MSRIIRSRKSQAVDTTKLNELLDDYADAEASMAVASRHMQTAEAAVFKEMHRLKMQDFSCERAKAELFRPAGRSSTTIDPVGFRKLVTNDKDFFSCVKIGITEARKVLPMRQIDTVSIVTEAKPGEEKLKITVN